MEAVSAHLPLRLDTASVAPPRRVEAWRDVMYSLCCPMTCEAPGRDDFRARLIATDIGPIGVRHMWSDPYRCRQTQGTLARARRRLYVLTAATGGAFRMTQYGREVVIDAGTISLHSTMDLLEFVHEMPSSALIVTIPAEQLKQRLPIPEDYCARPIRRDGVLASIFFDTLDSAVRHRAGREPGVAGAVSERLLDLLASTLEHEAPVRASAVSAVGATHLRHAKAFIAENLHRADLGPQTIAAALGFSVRYLHHLFQDEPETIGVFLRNRRLAKAQALLSDAGFAALSVSEIAFRVGFRSDSHFVTAFKGAFGLTPKAFRQQAARPVEGGRPASPPAALPDGAQSASRG